jgi:hypothetical protein
VSPKVALAPEMATGKQAYLAPVVESQTAVPKDVAVAQWDGFGLGDTDGIFFARV